MGDAETLNGLLTYADRYVNQTWRDGGLTCPRNDQRFAAGGNPTLVDPLTENVLLGYARLNVPDGVSWTTSG